jgi:hypothetical protein
MGAVSKWLELARDYIHENRRYQILKNWGNDGTTALAWLVDLDFPTQREKKGE